MFTLHLLAAACSLLITSPYAQTINIDGQTVAANTGNIAPAVESVSDSHYRGIESLQLTDNVLTNLTNLGLSNISLFYFDDDSDAEKRDDHGADCKTMPGDLLYPGNAIWKVFDLLTGGALIKTVPLGSACYKGEYYDQEKCTFLINNWNDSDTHVVDPTSLMSPIYEGATCEPADGALNKTCTLGGFPEYSLNITNVAQIQLAINFARATNLRLVVRNTGHDFLGKNTGAGALSLWTHHLRDIETLRDYTSPSGSYQGPAMKLGAGVMVYELYEAADREGFTAVGGECRTVGVTGGYIAGGGHSPVTPVHGLGSDQVLSIDIVTPDGRFITADETQNQDLFWAIRGGGAATWGVVVSMTVKVHEKLPVAGMAWETTTVEMGITDDQFWQAIEAYWTRYPQHTEAKTYGYCRMSGLPAGGFAWRCLPFMTPGVNLKEFKKMVQPLLDDWEAIDVHPPITFFEYDNLYEAWESHFPVERVGGAYGRTSSRLIPRENFADAEITDKTIQTVRSVVEDGAFLVHYNMNADAPEGTPDSAANPAWRDNIMFCIIGLLWDAETPQDEVAQIHDKLTNDLTQRLKDIAPNGGGYGNEGDVMDPEFGQSFFGGNYKRLLEIKQRVDPKDVFWAPTAVGSEGWYITGQKPYMTTQNGRLCRRK